MPQVSAEMRWFLKAAHATEVTAFDQWFRSGPQPPGGGKARTDAYAVDASTDELGAKDRGGKPGLEVKVLVGNLGSLKFGARGGVVLHVVRSAVRNAKNLRRGLRVHSSYFGRELFQ